MVSEFHAESKVEGSVEGRLRAVFEGSVEGSVWGQVEGSINSMQCYTNIDENMIYKEHFSIVDMKRAYTVKICYSNLLHFI